MKLKMKNTESGRYEGFGPTGQYHCLVGHEYDVPDKLAKAWVSAGIAEVVKEEPTAKKEAATKPKGVKNGN